MTASDDPLFHLALPEDWTAAFTDGEYRMSTRGATLDEVGFVHAASAEQVDGVARRFYGDVDELVLLTIDPTRLDAEVRWEPPAPGVDERFPHVYGPIPIAAVRATRHWRRGPRGWSTGDL